MMFSAELRLLLNTLKNNFFMMVITSLSFPIFLVFIMSSVTEKTFMHTPERLEIPVQIVDEDHSSGSKQLVQALDSMRDQGLLVYDDEAEYTIQIPEGYEESVLGNREAEVTVGTGVDYSYLSTQILVDVISQVTRQQQEALRLEQAMLQNQLNEIDQAAFNERLSTLTQVQIEDIQTVTPEVSLTARQHYALNYFQYVMITLAISIMIGTKTMRETSDLEMRMNVSPNPTITKAASSMLSNALLFCIVGFTYVLLMRVLSWGFTGNLVMHLVLLFIFSLIFSSIGTILSQMISTKFMPLVSQLLMLGVFLLGGLIPPLNFFEGTFLESITEFNPFQATIRPFRGVELHTLQWTDMTPYALVAIGALALALLALSFKKEVKA